MLSRLKCVHPRQGMMVSTLHGHSTSGSFPMAPRLHGRIYMRTQQRYSSTVVRAAGSRAWGQGWARPAPQKGPVTKPDHSMADTGASQPTAPSSPPPSPLSTTTTARKLTHLIASELVARGYMGSVCVLASMLLKEALGAHGVEATMRQGYMGLIFPGIPTQWTWHVWVEVDGEEMDAGLMVCQQFMASLSSQGAAIVDTARHVRVLQLPPGERCIVLGEKEEEEDRATVKWWAVIQESDDVLEAYWKSHAPRSALAVREWVQKLAV